VKTEPNLTCNNELVRVGVGSTSAGKQMVFGKRVVVMEVVVVAAAVLAVMMMVM